MANRNLIITSTLINILERIEKNKDNNYSLTTLGKVKIVENNVVKQLEVCKLEYGDSVCLERIVRGRDGVDYLSSERFNRWDEPKDWKIDIKETEISDNLQLVE